MSHFTVLVVTSERPTDEILAKALQPFHEFECTGTNDEYVQDIDETEEFIENHSTATRTKLRGPLCDFGHPLYDYEDSIFYRDPTPEERVKIGPGGSGTCNGTSFVSCDWGDGLGYRTKVRISDETLVELGFTREETGMSLREYADYEGKRIVESEDDIDTSGEHKYGYALFDGDNLVRVVDRTNPNKKWDLWVVGGRWSGMLLPKPDSVGECEVGRPGALGTVYDPSWVDVAQKLSVDFERMASRKTANRIKDIEETLTKLSSKTGKTRDELLAIHSAASAAWPEVKSGWGERGPFFEFLNGLPIDNPVKIARELKLWHCFNSLVDDYGCGVPETEPDPFAWANKPEPFSCFAMLRDGKWLQRGDIGWWGCVSNENKDHEAQFTAALADIPDDHWLTVVDCHI